MKHLILIFAILLGCFTSKALSEEPYTIQTPEPLNESWRWSSLEKLDALNALVIDESKDGDIWFGNIGSIAKFNGFQVKTHKFDTDFLNSINSKNLSTKCSDLLVLADSNPLCIIEGNLVKNINGKWKIIYKKKIKSGDCKNLLRTPNGDIWVLNKHSLMNVNKEGTEIKHIYQAEKNSSFLKFCYDQQDTFWVIQELPKTQLIKIRTENGQPVSRERWETFPMPSNGVTLGAKLQVHPNGNVYYIDRIQNLGLHCFDTTTQTWQQPVSTNLNRHHALCITNQGDIWIGGRKTLYIHGQNKQFHYSGNEKFPLSIIEHIYLDQSNRLWLIDRTKRIYLADLSSNNWTSYLNLHYKCTTSNNIQWYLSNKNKIISHRDSIWTKFDTEDGLIDKPSRVIDIKQNSLWVSGLHQNKPAISIYNGEHWTRHENITPHNIIHSSILEASDQTIWFGIQQELGPNSKEVTLKQYRIDDKGNLENLKSLKTPLGRLDYSAQTPDGKIWLGGFALYYLDTNTQKITLEESIPYRNVTNLKVTSDGSLWVTQTGLGLHRYYKGQWTNYNKIDGLVSSSIFDLLCLENGHLLAASDSGISRFDGQRWIPNAYPKEFYVSNSGGSIEKGLDQSIWINFDSKNTQSLQNIDYQTLQIKPISHQPETKISFSPQTIPYQGSSIVSWSGSTHWLNFSPEVLYYSWRINGGPWSDFERKNEHTFTDLSQGSYLLEVKARDLNFNIDPTPAQTAFTVLGPIWKEPWFILLNLVTFSIITYLIWSIIKAKERHLLQQQDASEKHWAELDQLKTIFFSNVTHELRTPLTVVLSRLESMLSSETDQEKKTLLSIMLRNTNRISVLISQLLDFKKLEEQKILLETTEGDIGLFIQEVIERSQPFAEDHQCQITFEGHSYGLFDPDKLDKIVTNLISNAIKYSTKGGEINVYIKEEDINTQHYLVIQITDHGCGIDQNQIKHIFERFYRISDTSHVDGVGIGLSHTKELVNLWNGEINAQSPIHESIEQPGTRITIRLPIDKKTAPSSTQLTETTQAEEDSDSTSEKNYNILVVEDDPEIRSILVDELGSTYHVHMAENGKIGVDKAQELMPDLILSDLMMPDMNGLELCQDLKSNQVTSHIPIILLTAKASLDSQIEGLEKGADDYITKPFHMPLLKKKISNLLSHVETLRGKFSTHYMLPDQALPENTLDKEFLLEVFSILEIEVKDVNFDAEGLARKLHMSTSTLRRKLKAVTDDTPAKLIRDMRLKMGADLLKNSDLSVTQIALEVGFNESNYFARIFKSVYNQTPSQYRSQESI